MAQIPTMLCASKFIDRFWLPYLKPSEYVIVRFILQRTIYYGKDFEKISVTHFVDGVYRNTGELIQGKTGLSRATIINCIKILMQRKVIQKHKIPNKSSFIGINFDWCPNTLDDDFLTFKESEMEFRNAKVNGFAHHCQIQSEINMQKSPKKLKIKKSGGLKSGPLGSKIYTPGGLKSGPPYARAYINNINNVNQRNKPENNNGVSRLTAVRDKISKKTRGKREEIKLEDKPRSWEMIWQDELKKQFPKIHTVSWSAKSTAQMKQLRKRLGPDFDFGKFLVFVISRWGNQLRSRFTRGRSKLLFPRTPSVGFLVGCIESILDEYNTNRVGWSADQENSNSKYELSEEEYNQYLELRANAGMLKQSKKTRSRVSDLTKVLQSPAM